MTQNRTASPKDDSQLRGKEARPAAKDDATKMNDKSANDPKSKDGDKKASGGAPMAGKADGKSSGGRSGK